MGWQLGGHKAAVNALALGGEIDASAEADAGVAVVQTGDLVVPGHDNGLSRVVGMFDVKHLAQNGVQRQDAIASLADSAQHLERLRQTIGGVDRRRGAAPQLPELAVASQLRQQAQRRRHLGLHGRLVLVRQRTQLATPRPAAIGRRCARLRQPLPRQLRRSARPRQLRHPEHKRAQRRVRLRPVIPH